MVGHLFIKLSVLSSPTIIKLFYKLKDPEDNRNDHSHHNHYTNDYGDVCNCSMSGQSQFLLIYYQATLHL